MTQMRRRLIALSMSVVMLAACSDGGSNATDTVAATTEAPTTTAAPTTTRPATTTTTDAPTTTAAATTTTTDVLPVPAPAPEPRAAEPYIELGTIEIPKIGVSKPLLEGVTLTTLDGGPGHWPGTAMPGHLGNVVVGGHRTSHDRPFRNIDQLVAGDEVVFTTPEGRFVYHVTSTQIVTPDAIWIIDQKNEKTATLFACHPVGSTKERFIVFLALSE